MSTSISPLHTLFLPHTFQCPAMPPFTLDKTIFTPSLYKKVQDVWFDDQPIGTQDIDRRVIMKWFGAIPDQKDAFDTLCRDNFAHALEAIGPEHFPNPSAEPFLSQIRDFVHADAAGDAAAAAEVALSMVLLLDQMPRNIYRTNEGLAKVYNHYDKMAYALATSFISSADAPLPRPDLHPQWRRSPGWRYWFYLPFMHSEDLDAHRKVESIIVELKSELDGDGNEAARAFAQTGLDAEREHMDIIERFGRYPHRNAALRRVSTEEEKEFLRGGGATFGVVQGDAGK
jgi:uncharacterized protein (DUF924 family)